MSWNARFRAAMHGDVDGSDVVALLNSTRPLGDLRHGFDDRRLSSELAHIGDEWRVADELAPAAALLWVAEGMVTIAQSLLEAEDAAHPGLRATMSEASFSVCMGLLQPIGRIVAEVSAMLVDPSLGTTLPLPMRVTPPEGAVPYAVYPAHARGLLAAAERLQGSVAGVLQDYLGLAQRSPAPQWFSAGLQRMRAELAAAGSRQEMASARLAPLLAHQALDDLTLRQTATDLWLVIEVYLRAGQTALAPRLLPGAPPPGEFAPSTGPDQQPAPLPLPAPTYHTPGAPVVAPPSLQAPPAAPPPIQPAPHPSVAMPAPPAPRPVAAPPPPSAARQPFPPAHAVPFERPRELPRVAPEWRVEPTRDAAPPASPASSTQWSHASQPTAESPPAAPMSRTTEQHPRALPRIGGVEPPIRDAEHDQHQTQGGRCQEETQGQSPGKGEQDIDPATGARRLPHIG